MTPAWGIPLTTSGSLWTDRPRRGTVQSFGRIADKFLHSRRAFRSAANGALKSARAPSRRAGTQVVTDRGQGGLPLGTGGLATGDPADRVELVCRHGSKAATPAGTLTR